MQNSLVSLLVYACPLPVGKGPMEVSQVDQIKLHGMNPRLETVLHNELAVRWYVRIRRWIEVDTSNNGWGHMSERSIHNMGNWLKRTTRKLIGNIPAPFAIASSEI